MRKKGAIPRRMRDTRNSKRSTLNLEGGYDWVTRLLGGYAWGTRICKHMLELYEGVHRIISSFQLFNLVLIRFRLENDEKIGKIHVDLLCSGGISEDVASTSFLICVQSC